VPAAVARLSRRVARTLLLARVGVAAALILVAVMGMSIGLAAALKPAEKAQRAPAGGAMEKPGGGNEKARAPRDEKDAKAAPMVIRGQVLDPDGKPVAGAEVLLSLPGPRLEGEVRRLGTAGADGRFEVSIPRDLKPKDAPVPDAPWLKAAVAAAAPGLGPDWSILDPAKPSDAITLKLRRDDVPIEGRIISLEGRPIPDLSVKVAYIAEFPPEVMRKLRENAGRMNPSLWGELRNVFIPGEKGAFLPVRTGADGRFRITGIGRDRATVLIVDGGSIEQSIAIVSTSGDRDYKPVPLPSDGSGERKIEAPRFDMAVAPGRVIEGTVRDRDTGQPIADARIRNWFGAMITADAQGHFRVAGQPKGRENTLEVSVAVDGQPYIKVVKSFSDPRGLAPVQLDIPLKRGIWVEGKVTNRANGKPVKAVVVYFPFRDNPGVKDCPDASFLDNNVSDEVEFPTDDRGHFRAVALPGEGILAVSVKEPGYVNDRRLDSKTAGNVLHAADFNYYMYPYHALVPIDAPAGKTLVIPDIALTPGRTQHIQIAGPDGRPVLGTRILCLQSGSTDGEAIKGDECTFIHANPGKAESLIISQADRSLGATIDLKGDEPDPVRVVLQPCGTVTGRLVDEDGKPRPDVKLGIQQRFMTRGDENGTDRFDPVTTGPDGRFRIKNLVPGLTYNVEAIKPNESNYSLRAEGYLHKNHWTLKLGETLDWGDVQVKPYRP
jgi:hypothetical protein